jgi:enamine deaminase RidA (YjgF/YER057c/UK114 family)
MPDGPDHIRGPFPWAATVDYSQAVVANGLIFISGQYGADDDGNVVSDDFREQARATFTNLRRVLEEAGAGLSDLIQLRGFLLRAEDFGAYKEVRREFLSEPYPGSLVVCAPAFTFPGMLIEIEAVARLRD